MKIQHVCKACSIFTVHVDYSNLTDKTIQKKIVSEYWFHVVDKVFREKRQHIAPLFVESAIEIAKNTSIFLNCFR